MSSRTNREAAVELLAMADAAGLEGIVAYQRTDDPMAAIPSMASALLNIFAAQVYATLAVADATAAARDGAS